MTSQDSQNRNRSTGLRGPGGVGRLRQVPADRVADVVLTSLLLALFAWAYLEAGHWSFRASLFPRLVAGSAFALAALHLVQSLLELRKGSADPTGPGAEDDAGRDDVEYVFATAGAESWAAALAWITGFFIALYVAGLFVTGPLFALLYLRFAGRRTWLLSAVYAAVAGTVLYVAFDLLLNLPTPPGLFLQ